MIKLVNITNECFDSISFEIGEGSICKIITNSEHDKRILMDTVLALRKPLNGEVFLFNKNIYSLPERELLNIMKNIGMVWRNGGVISNLKIWENITLPVWYHKGIKPETIEDSVIEIFKQLGKDISELPEYMGKLSGTLPFHEKRLISIVRAMLMDPELMLYDSVLDGLNPDIAKKVTDITTQFHSKKIGRTSVYISSDEQSLRDIKADIVLMQYRRGLNYEDNKRV
ncbi:MAG: ATP-binding cassette domain-containing protein [Nitrospirota bacterium]